MAMTATEMGVTAVAMAMTPPRWSYRRRDGDDRHRDGSYRRRDGDDRHRDGSYAVEMAMTATEMELPPTRCR